MRSNRGQGGGVEKEERKDRSGDSLQDSAQSASDARPDISRSELSLAESSMRVTEERWRDRRVVAG